MRKFATIFTYIVHPATLALIGVFLIVLHETENVQQALFWTFLSSFFYFAYWCFAFFGVKKKFFSNVDVSDRRQRVIMYPFVVAVVLLLAGLGYMLDGPLALILGGLFSAISLIVFDIINTKIKASIHVASITALSIVLCSIYGEVAYFTLLLIPLIAWARIVQRRHTLKETIVGGVWGFILTIVALVVIQYISEHVTL